MYNLLFIFFAMNIFYLSSNPKEAAVFHVDKHVVKMILESAQLLCTAHRILDGTLTTRSIITKTGKPRNKKHYALQDSNLDNLLYSATHINHPCAIWCRANINNYMWLYDLFVCLCDEYTFRYGKKHKTDLLLRTALANAPISISQSDFTSPAQAMPKQYKHTDPVVAYRQYYIGAKHKFAKWTSRSTPNWFVTPEISNANV